VRRGSRRRGGGGGGGSTFRLLCAAASCYPYQDLLAWINERGAAVELVGQAARVFLYLQLVIAKTLPVVCTKDSGQLLEPLVPLLDVGCGATRFRGASLFYCLEGFIEKHFEIVANQVGG